MSPDIGCRRERLLDHNASTYIVYGELANIIEILKQIRFDIDNLSSAVGGGKVEIRFSGSILDFLRSKVIRARFEEN